MMALNDREKMFADEFIKTGNAYQAALNAGYAESTALDANKWIKPDENPKKPHEKSKFKPHVRAFIDQRMAEKESELIADQDEVLKYLTAVMRKKTMSSVLARDETGAERVIQKLPDEKESLKAAELLGKRYGLYTDKVDGTLSVGVTIIDDIGEEQ